MSDPNAYQRRVFGRELNEWQRVVDNLSGAEGANDTLTTVEDLNRLRKIASRIHDCCRYPSLWAHADDTQLMTCEGRCRSRLCPRCGRIRARQLQPRLELLAAQLDSPRFITLGTASNNRPLKEQLAHLVESFKRLRRCERFKARVRGGVYVIEVTYNAKTEQWHPHLHALTEGTYYHQAELSKDWESATGDSYVAHIKAVPSRSKAAGYLTQYVTKSQDASHVPDLRLPEWAAAMHGARCSQTWGTLHGLQLDETEEESKPQINRAGSLLSLAHAAAEGDEEAKEILGQATDRTLHLPWTGPAAGLALRVETIRLVKTRMANWEARRLGATDPNIDARGRAPTRAREPAVDPALWADALRPGHGAD
jgi:hypothetical protein